jgi:hypothetical protein
LCRNLLGLLASAAAEICLKPFLAKAAETFLARSGAGDLFLQIGLEPIRPRDAGGDLECCRQRDHTSILDVGSFGRFFQEDDFDGSHYTSMTKVQPNGIPGFTAGDFPPIEKNAVFAQDSAAVFHLKRTYPLFTAGEIPRWSGPAHRADVISASNLRLKQK